MKGIIFDLDGVITDTAKFHFEAWHALATSLGIPFDAAFNEKLKGVSRMDSLKLILENGNKLDHFNSEELQELAAKKKRALCALARIANRKRHLTRHSRTSSGGKKARRKMRRSFRFKKMLPPFCGL